MILLYFKNEKVSVEFIFFIIFLEVKFSYDLENLVLLNGGGILYKVLNVDGFCD